MSKKPVTDEQIKLIIDHTKHLTTLSTGSIVLIITFKEKLANNPQWEILIVIALIAFVISILAATFSHIGLIKYLAMEEDIDSGSGNAILLSWIAFLVAMVSLCVFGVRNLL